ncbi:MAG: 3'-5' exonuclease [Spirochaetales bacterium]|nr:3'-5' exonuclease [Spirochaetales bacterium]
MFKFIDAAPLIKAIDGMTDFVAVDLETTGLDPAYDRITEIGAVRFTLTGSGSVYETLVDPGMPISPDASSVSGITDGMVRGKPTIGEKIGEFLSFIGDSPLVAHNARFDGGFLRAAYLREGLSLHRNPIFDTRLLAKRLWPEWRKYNLAKALEFLGLRRNDLHRALGDALACRDLFLACLGKLGAGRRLAQYEGKRIAIVLTEDDIDETI